MSKVIKKKVSDAELIELLDPHMIPSYDILYAGFRVNHLAQGAIALQSIGASKDRIKKYIDLYTVRLDKPKKEDLNAQLLEPEKYLGIDKNFHPIMKHYEELLQNKYNGDLDMFTADSYLKLHNGLVGKALHGILQVGYGYSINYPRMICEGLALSHINYLPPKDVSNEDYAKIGYGQCSLVSVMEKLSADEELRKHMLSLAQQTSGKTFITKIRVLNEQRSMDILKIAHSINLPYKDIDTAAKFEKVLFWLIQSTLYVFANSERKNDFFILHGVTGAWALSQVARMIYHKIGPKEALLVIQSFIFALITVYVSQLAPKLLNNEDALRQYINSEQPKIPENCMTKKEAPLWLQNLDLNVIIAKTLATDEDVHITKLVQIALEMFEKDSGDESLCYLYERASNLVLTHKFLY